MGVSATLDSMRLSYQMRHVQDGRLSQPTPQAFAKPEQKIRTEACSSHHTPNPVKVFYAQAGSTCYGRSLNTQLQRTNPRILSLQGVKTLTSRNSLQKAPWLTDILNSLLALPYLHGPRHGNALPPAHEPSQGADKHKRSTHAPQRALHTGGALHTTCCPTSTPQKGPQNRGLPTEKAH